MSIQKKSLISTLKTAKRANVASRNTSDGEAKGSKVASMRLTSTRQIAPKAGVMMKSTKISAKTATSAKSSTTKAL